MQQIPGEIQRRELKKNLGCRLFRMKDMPTMTPTNEPNNSKQQRQTHDRDSNRNKI